MKKVKSFYSFVNEGIRDKMTPKAKEDIKKSLEKTPALTVLTGIDKYKLEDVFTQEEIKGLKDRAKRYLNRLSVDDRVDKVFGEIGDPLNIYTEQELKRLIDQIDELENQLEKISNYKLQHLYTKEELKHIVDQFPPYKRFGLIHNYDMMKIFTPEEIEQYMEDSDDSDIYRHFLSKVRSGDLEEVKKLMDRWKLSVRGKGSRLVEYTIESGNLGLVEYLIEKGMDISDMNFHQFFSIMCRDVNKDIIKFFLSKSPELQRGLNEKKRLLKWETEVIQKYE